MTAPRGAGKPERRYPITPRPEQDPRFTFGLLVDVMCVLTRHGYDEPAAGDAVDLQQALFVFLYGDAPEGGAQ